MNLSHYEKLKSDLDLRFQVCKDLTIVQLAVSHSLQEQAALLPLLISSLHRFRASRESKYVPSLMPTFLLLILFTANSHKMSVFKFITLFLKPGYYLPVLQLCGFC